jgi:hypothetical protein
VATPALKLLVAVGLAVAALLVAAAPASEPVRWTPDGLFYQARSLELRGTDRDAALRETFGGPLGAELRARDPERSGDPDWVRYSAQFYERRVAVPLAANAIQPISGDRALLDVSLAGYVASILALFALMLTRFRLEIAAAVTLATVFLPALTFHSGFPLTDSWGLALQTAALGVGILALERGPRWLLPWTALLALLALTRDSSWIPLLAAAGVALTFRSRVTLGLLAGGLLATLPVLLLFSVPTRELLAMMMNDLQPAPDASWGFVAERYPAAVLDLIQADGGFVRDGAWYSAIYLVAGLTLLFVFTRDAEHAQTALFLRLAALASMAYVLVVPVFSAFRLELVCVPLAAYGLGLGAERLATATLPWVARARIRMDKRSRHAGLA